MERHRKRRGAFVGAGLVASAALLSGCVSNVPGIASMTPDAEKWVPPLGEDDLNGVLLDIDALNDAVGASDLDFFREETDLVDMSDQLASTDCLAAFNAGEQLVYQDSDYASAEVEMATEPGDAKDHWVQQVVVLFPSSVEALAFFAQSQETWDGCSQEDLETFANDEQTETHLWRIDDLEVAEEGSLPVGVDGSMSQFSEQTDAVDPWGCDHTMSAVSNVVVEGVTCSGDGPGQGTDLNDALVGNVNNS
ncbi:MAG: sensor domain-containing protein [Mycobacterium sp.]